MSDTLPSISKITLPSGTTYNLKDEEARSAIGQLNSFSYAVSKDAATTPYGVTWDSGGTTITGTLVASASTMYKIYLVPSVNGTNDVFDEYITVIPSENVYSWEMFGNTSAGIDDLGAFAIADTGTVSVTPHGSNSTSTVTFGNHTTATVLTSSTTGTVPKTTSSTKYLTASASGTEVSVATSDTALTGLGSPSTAKFVKSYPGVSSKLSTTSVIGVGSSTTTASKATAGTPISVAATDTATDVASGELGTETSTRTADTPMWGASVTNETLSFTFKPLSTKSIVPAKTGESITPYTFEDVTVPIKDANATTVATGSLANDGAGGSVLTGLGTAVTDDGVTGYSSPTSDTFAKTVSVTTQPTITLASSASTSTGAAEYVESISESGTNSVTFSSNTTANAITELGTATAGAQTFTGTTESFTVYPVTPNP